MNCIILSSSELHGSTDCIMSSTTPPSSIISPTHLAPRLLFLEGFYHLRSCRKVRRNVFSA